MGYYILQGRETYKVDDLYEWAMAFEKCNRVINKTTIENCDVSTVFLGMDYSYKGKKPLLFETMIFGGANDGYQKRYSTYSESEAGHEMACKMLLRLAEN